MNLTITLNGSARAFKSVSCGIAAMFGSLSADAQSTNLHRDISAILENWGKCTSPCRFDLDGNGIVGSEDLQLTIEGMHHGNNENEITPESRFQVRHVRLISPKLDNEQSARKSILWRSVVRAPGAIWIRIHFEDWNLGGRSAVVVRSRLDDRYQKLDALALSNWSGSSAWFFGNSVDVELHVAPGDANVFVDIRRALFLTTIGECISGDSGICGNDDRVTSTDLRNGRLATPDTGNATHPFCSAWLISNGLVLSAGHCQPSAVPWDIDVVEFNVPQSLPNGTPVPAAPEDQFPIVVGSAAMHDGGAGDDWATFRLGTNSISEVAHVKFGFHRITATAPLVGSAVRVTGYGTDNDPPGSTGNLNSDSQTLQTDIGAVTVFAGPVLRHTADMSCGSSGCPVIVEATGVAIGINTHAGCPDSTNAGTAFGHLKLVQSISSWPSASSMHVDGQYPASLNPSPMGTVLRPFATAAEGINAASNGSYVSLVRGAYSEKLVIPTPRVLVAPVGPVIIGD